MTAVGKEALPLLYAPNRGQWRTWLKEHYKSEKEIWLVYYKKHTGKPRIAYNDAVEEALCFGWIDSTVRRIDADRYAQRFSPRKKGSGYSRSNMERLALLAKQGKVMKEVLAAAGGISECAVFPGRNGQYALRDIVFASRRMARAAADCRAAGHPG